MRKISKYAVLSISVLSASLLNEFIISKIVGLYKDRTYLSVLIGMIITVAVFVPLVGLLGTFIKKMSNEYIRSSKKLGKNSKSGLIIGCLIAFVILFILFAHVRHNLDLIHDLKKLM